MRFSPTVVAGSAEHGLGEGRTAGPLLGEASRAPRASGGVPRRVVKVSGPGAPLSLGGSRGLRALAGGIPGRTAHWWWGSACAFSHGRKAGCARRFAALASVAAWSGRSLSSVCASGRRTALALLVPRWRTLVPLLSVFSLPLPLHRVIPPVVASTHLRKVVVDGRREVVVGKVLLWARRERHGGEGVGRSHSRARRQGDRVHSFELVRLLLVRLQVKLHRGSFMQERNVRG